MIVLGLLGWILYLLFDTDQFTYTKWMPFEYKGIQELLLRGLGNTLKAFAHRRRALAGARAPCSRRGGCRTTGRCAGSPRCVVEFFRAMPVLVMIFFIFVALKVQPLPALVAGLTLYNGSVLAEVFRSGVNSVERGQREAAFALGMRKTQVMTYVLVPQAVRAMLPTIISQLVVALKDTSLGYLITYEEFLHAGKLIASNLDYDLPFIPVVMVISPIYIGMCMLLSLVRPVGVQAAAAQSQDRGRGRRPGRTRDAAAGWGSPTAPRLVGSRAHRAMTRPAAAGDHCSRRGTDTYDGSSAGEEKVSCAPVGLCSM